MPLKLIIEDYRCHPFLSVINLVCASNDYMWFSAEHNVCILTYFLLHCSVINDKDKKNQDKADQVFALTVMFHYTPLFYCLNEETITKYMF